MLAHQCLPTTPIANTALVAEGGGQRGIFTAGILDAWLLAGFNPFDLLIGTSAGAQNLSSYMTCQPGFGLRSITQFSQHPHFFKLHRTLMGKHAVDLDWYFDQVNQPEHRLNLDCGISRLKDRQLLFSATRIKDRRAQFFAPNHDNWIDMLKASSALPILYKDGVKIGQDHFVDGGLSAPLPVEEAYKRGAKKIIVIRTVAENANIESIWAHKIKSWLCNTRRCPKIIDLITHHEESYQKTLDFISKPPSDVEIIQLFPADPLASHLVGSQKHALERDYAAGVEIGEFFLNNLPQAISA